MDSKEFCARIRILFKQYNIKLLFAFLGLYLTLTNTYDLKASEKSITVTGEIQNITSKAEIFLDKVDGQEKITLESLNELLIKEGHAKEYHGGKR